MTLFSLDEQQRRTLAARAERACVVYNDHPLPIGVKPETGRIGIEGDGRRIALHLGGGHTYNGTSLVAERLVTDGTAYFGTVDELIRWLASASQRRTEPANPPLPATPSSSAEPQPVPQPLTAPSLELALGERVVGQPNACRVAARSVTNHLAKVAPAGPLTMLFVGPTGVGKTLLAETLAARLDEVGDGRCGYFRVDMSELREGHRVARLLGAPPGYVGHQTTPPLITHLRSNPRSVILFDEIDKAHPDVVTALMNMFDVGRLTPEGGDDTIDLTRSILIATSNQAAEEIHDFATDNAGIEAATAVRDLMVAGGMPKEQVARFDEVVPFNQLTEAATAALVILAIRRCAAEYGVTLSAIDPAVALEVIDNLPPEDRFGARTINRMVNEIIGSAVVDLAGQGAFARLLLTADRKVVTESG